MLRSSHAGSAGETRGAKKPARARFQALSGNRRILVAAVHMALVPLAYFCAFALRFDFDVPPRFLGIFWVTVPLLLLVRMAAFHAFGLLRGYWRHVGARDLTRLVVACTLGSLAFVAATYLVQQLDRLPRSVILLEWLLILFLSGGIRFVARYAREGRLWMKRRAGRRTLVIGAGDAAEQLLRQVIRGGHQTMHVVGLVDDDPDTHGMLLHGVRVWGTIDDIPRLTLRHEIELLVIGIPSASGDQMRRIVDRCRQTGVDFKILPPLDELVDGRVDAAEVRDVQIEDLLGREPVNLDLERIEQDLAGKSVLVTGGAGSIGSELARQIARFGPKRLVLLERAESPLYFVHLEISRSRPNIDVVPVIANITNRGRLEEVFDTYEIDYVFHAAAYKHVPMMEASVVEALWNNVVGTLRVAETAAHHGVAKFVLISTDKAVNPTSLMGATKRIAERIVLELPWLRSSATDFRAVRFGNVLGSDGSVVPLFKRQLAEGGPLTVTHPDVERYFMTIPEAVQLVLSAAALPEAASRICMLEMGKPVRILDLAEQLIRLSGLVPYRDVQIAFMGLRPGEKLQEELVACNETTVATSVEKIRVVENNGTDGVAFQTALERLQTLLTQDDQSMLLAQVMTLVPEYSPRSSGPEAHHSVTSSPRRRPGRARYEALGALLSSPTPPPEASGA